MLVKEIDKEINKLVVEKKLLNESKKRTTDINEIQGINKRLIMLNAEIRKLKEKYNEKEEDKND